MKSILFIGITENVSIRGVERVVLETLRALGRDHSGRYKFYLLCGSWQDYYKDLESFGIKLIYAECGKSTFSRHFYLWIKAGFVYQKYDIVHFMNTMPSLFRKNNYIFTIHDLAEFGCPSKYSFLQAAYRRFVSRWLMSGSSKIITISNFSKNEIKKWCNTEVDAIVFNGLNHFSCEIIEDNLNKFINFGDYILYFGVLEKTKGLDTAIKIFLEMKKNYPEDKTKFLVVGAKGNLFGSVSKYFDEENIIYIGRLDDFDLKVMIKKSKAVLFFSEYEGFGMPAPESVVMGAKVIVKSGSVFQEICGDACIAIDTESSDAYRMLFEAINEDFFVSSDLVLKKYNWENSAKILSNFYEKLI